MIFNTATCTLFTIALAMMAALNVVGASPVDHLERRAASSGITTSSSLNANGVAYCSNSPTIPVEFAFNPSTGQLVVTAKPASSLKYISGAHATVKAMSGSLDLAKLGGFSTISITQNWSLTESITFNGTPITSMTVSPFSASLYNGDGKLVVCVQAKSITI